MRKRALGFLDAHTEQVSEDLPPLSRLKEILARADQLIIQQRDGVSEVRAATLEKREMRRKIRRTHLPHFTRVAEAAVVERPELARKFELPAEALPYLAFRSAVQGIIAEAQNQQELLFRYGLVEPASQSLADAVAQFDRAVERGESGRRAHVGARAELEAISDEIIQKVRQLDGLARFRFATDVEALAAWRSASNTIGPARSGGQAVSRTDGQGTENPATPTAGGEVKPAA
jgi:hypothetical protein